MVVAFTGLAVNVIVKLRVQDFVAMFTNDAKRYANTNRSCCISISDVDLLEKAFNDGAKFGYNKAKEELRKVYCSRCIHSDGNGHCITKYEAPSLSFVCDNGEMFEEYEEDK